MSSITANASASSAEVNLQVEPRAAPKTLRCAVVTGGNRGIGLEICRQLASNNILVVLTARDEKRGNEAVDFLKKLGFSNVVFHQLDIKDPTSISSLANFIKNQFGKLDILVNNAGDFGVIIDPENFRAKGGFDFILDFENAEKAMEIMEQPYYKAEECLKINYYGMKNVTEALLPLLQLSNSARIVNISSVYGLLRYLYNEKVRAQLTDIDSLTEEYLDDLLQCFLKDFKEDMLESNGWPIPISAYKMSHVTINAYTRILARKFSKLQINCVDPGYVKTDLTCKMGDLTPEEGARAPVMVALLPDDSPTGSYFDRMEISSFY
ncbi:hypothetical protein GIB67_001084 [Kingdonia uniflora]|uniref:Short-chain dehydrogenase/reductase n=1 Tax=Kingdonia uniflora TaxID=39325 RepID=A0A7J7MG48_9MAGN|nr:hypothetical protein GIB67_001084 [Kingdonia uniflora]